MGRLLKVFAILVMALGTLHCANKKSYKTAAAPSSGHELGLIVKTTEAQLDTLLEKYPQGTVRALSAQHGIFEVSHVSFLDAQKISSRPVYKNTFVQGIKKSEDKKLSLSNLAMNTSADAVAAIQTCAKTETSPTVDVDISFNPDSLTIELGEEVTLSAKGIAHETVGGDLRFIWDIQPPGFSQQSFSAGIARSQQFIPDSVGMYQIAVIAQGADLSCSVIVVPLLVTANPEISAQAPSLARPDDISFFTHLGYISASAAWEKSKGKDILVAVLDSGVNYNHPGIRNNIAIKRTEVIDGKDEDGNGVTDDTIGWDFIANDRFPFDDDGHGSHVAGLVASPVLGVASESKILPVKVLNAAGSSDIGTVVAGIYYAVDSGAQIINASLGFQNLTEPPQPLIEALEYARSKNVIFLAAAGNGDETGRGYDIKARPVYPASANLDNMIVVAATALKEITSYSNFNNELVHVAAPGGNQNEFVMSLATLNPAQSMLAGQSGTSMATPVTAGVVALMLSSAKTTLTPSQVRQILMDTGDDLVSLKDKTISGRQVNALKAVQAVLDLELAPELL